MSHATHQDWHPADIIAALKKRGTNLAELSRASGLASSTLGNALNRSWPKGEKLIAEALDMPPQAIWPSRYYDAHGQFVDRQRMIRKTLRWR